MVIIAIMNIPPKMTLKHLVKCLAPTIQGHFEALNFTHGTKGKTAYLRLAEKLSAKDVINRLNCRTIGPNPLKAFIPDVVPDLPLSYTPKTIPMKTRRKLNIAPNFTAKERLTKSVDNIMREMTYKYVGLHSLSSKTDHQLLETIGLTVCQRIKKILDNPAHADTPGFHVTKLYRKKYPHYQDFKLIAETLNAVREAQGKRPMLLSEKHLAFSELNELNKVPYDNLLSMCVNQVDRISSQLVQHVRNLETNENPSSMEEAAQTKVRKHLKNLAQHIPNMVNQVVLNYMVPTESQFLVVKIYGEPYLPGKDIWGPFFAQFQPVTTIRSEQMYNQLTIKVPREMYSKILKVDGTVISGAKLIIRPSKLPFYKVSRYLMMDDGPAALPAADASAASDAPDDEQGMEWSESW